MDSKNDHGSTSAQAPIEKTIGDLIVGPPKNIRDPRLFHRISLVAFLAWVGLGSDGLSSSCYGPEEAFLALGQHQYLADHRSVSERGWWISGGNQLARAVSGTGLGIGTGR
jgi:hypothetical protein